MKKILLVSILSLLSIYFGQANAAHNNFNQLTAQNKHIASEEQTFESTKLLPTSTMGVESLYMTRLLEELHFLKKPLTSIDAKKLMEDYLANLDFYKMWLDKEAINEITKNVSGTAKEFVSVSNLGFPFEAFESYRNATRNRIKWITLRLKKPFNLEQDGTFCVDRKEAEWPKNKLEADELWEKRLTNEVITEIIAIISKENAELARKQKLTNLLRISFISKEGMQKMVHDSKNYYRSTAYKNILIFTIIKKSQDTFFLAPQKDALNCIGKYLKNKLLINEKFEEAKIAIKKRYEVFLKNLNLIEATEVHEFFLNALASKYDPHTNFLSADSMEDFSIAMHNSLVGIGAYLRDEDGYCIIVSLLPGGPAEKSHQLKAGDKILSVGEDSNSLIDIYGIKLNKTVKLIRGPKGTKVHLIVQSAEGGPSERKEVVLIRDEVKLTESLAKAKLFEIKNNSSTFKIGIIDIPNFYTSETSNEHNHNTTDDVSELIEKLKMMKMDALVLDLRRNGGGVLTEAIRLTGLFAPNSPVVQVKDTSGRVQKYYAENNPIKWDGPLSVLVTRGTASASEIVAGALKTHKRAIIVGEEATTGKGSVQALLELNKFSLLPNLSQRMGAAKITIQKWYLPDGNSTQRKGVKSDITFPSFNKVLKIGEEDFPSALNWDRIEPMSDKERPNFAFTINQDLISTLALKSKFRQSNSEEFLYWNAMVEYFKQKYDKKKYLLNLQARLKGLCEDACIMKAFNYRSKLLLEKNTLQYKKILLNYVEPNIEEENHDTGVDVFEKETVLIMKDWLENLKALKELKDAA